MAKKVYGHDGEDMEGIMPHIVRKPTKAKHQGYDYIDPRGKEIAKGAIKGVGKALGKISKYLDPH